jgi:hypothetical protein
LRPVILARNFVFWKNNFFLGTAQRAALNFAEERPMTGASELPVITWPPRQALAGSPSTVQSRLRERARGEGFNTTQNKNCRRGVGG